MCTTYEVSYLASQHRIYRINFFNAKHTFSSMPVCINFNTSADDVTLKEFSYALIIETKSLFI